MLSYLDCRKLRDAGYPQGASAMVLLVPALRDGVPRVVSREHAEAMHCHSSQYIDDPNSDELIAAIQVRWPELDLVVEGETFIDHATQLPFKQWTIAAGPNPTTARATGGMPAAALCALYLALAGGTDAR